MRSKRKPRSIGRPAPGGLRPEPECSCPGYKFPKIRFPRETQRRYTPWLLIRYADGDDGSRPLPPGSASWESPDIWVESRLGINQPIPGEDNTVFARVSNRGLQDATGVIVKFYWVNPSLAIFAAHLIGVGYANIQSKDTAIMECPTKWVPDIVNGGAHQCLIVEAFVPAFDDLTAPLDSWDDRHVGQKNEQLVVLGPSEFFSTTVEAANALGVAQALTFEVQPVRRIAIPQLRVARARALPAEPVPPSLVLPLTFEFSKAPPRFTGPTALFARRLLSQTLQDMAGTAKFCSLPAQISHTAQFEPWETRTIEITGQVPPDARPGQTFAFRIVQRAGRMITGGYTVTILTAESRPKKEKHLSRKRK
jgi:hypothetical protein